MTIICIFSLFVSNLGLTQLIAVTLPVLIAIYPVAIELMLLSFVHKHLEGKETVYIDFSQWMAMFYSPFITNSWLIL